MTLQLSQIGLTLGWTFIAVTLCLAQTRPTWPCLGCVVVVQCPVAGQHL
ncbi:hypothetical protein [Microlunatus soli]|nr:hypothetical protein [Microlunatus soli]